MTSDGSQPVPVQAREVDGRLLKAAEALGPEQTMARLDDHVKTLLSTMALVGSVVTGFGVLTGATGEPTIAVRVLLISSVALAVISVVYALVALRSETARHVLNLDDVYQFFSDEVQRRESIARKSRAALIAAIALGGIAAVLQMVTAREQASISPTVSVVVGEGGARQVALRVSGTGLVSSDSISAWLTLIGADGTAVVVTQEVTTVDENGKFALESVSTVSDGREIQARIASQDWTCTGSMLLAPDPAEFEGPETLRCDVL